jgi:hypothetical protein
MGSSPGGLNLGGRLERDIGFGITMRLLADMDREIPTPRAISQAAW